MFPFITVLCPKPRWAKVYSRTQNLCRLTDFFRIKSQARELGAMPWSMILLGFLILNSFSRDPSFFRLISSGCTTHQKLPVSCRIRAFPQSVASFEIIGLLPPDLRESVVVSSGSLAIFPFPRFCGCCINPKNFLRFSSAEVCFMELFYPN